MTRLSYISPNIEWINLETEGVVCGSEITLPGVNILPEEEL